MRLRLLATATVLSMLIAALIAAPAAARPALSDNTVALGSGGYAVELSAPVPEWYTPELHREVLASGREGVPIPAGVEVPASALAFTGIRPGSWMIFPAGCTLNFVFGSAGAPYIGTAGHCANVGQPVTIIAAPGVLMNIGTVTKSVSGGIGNDFALIKIRDNMKRWVNPSMAIVAGPTGQMQPRFGTGVVHVGHGAGTGTGGTAKPGVITYVQGDAYGWVGHVIYGDSGSPNRALNGRAVGNVTHLIIGVPTAAGTSIGRMRSIAGLPLMTASLIPNPLP